MKVRFFRGAALALFFTGYMLSAWAGKPSSDRPSAHPLPPPSYTRNAPPEGFILPPVPESADEHGGDLRTLFVKHIVLEGNTIFPEKDLQSMVQPYEGRDVSIAELEDLRQKLTRYYIDHGYVNSGAVIPPEAFQDGELHFKIIEGQIDDIRLKGMGRLREGYVKNRLWNDPSQPFNLPLLQDRFQLLLSDPLISQMKGSILPGDTPGHSILDVEVSRSQPYQLTLFADNQRPPSVGSEGYGVNGWIRNLTTLGDTVDFTVTSSEGSDHYAGGFSLPITDSGVQLFFRFDEGDSSVVEEPLQKIDIKSTVHNIEGGISYPFIDTVRKHFVVGLTVAVRKNETTLLGRPFSFITGEETGKNQASVIRLFQDYSQRWEKHALTLRSTFNFGRDAWGSTVAKNSESPDSKFLSWLGQAQYAYRISDQGTQFLIRGNTQFSDDPLLPLERIAVGGSSTVRGYRENYLVRDQGYTLSTELHYPLFGGTDQNAKHRLTLIPFIDYGRAWNHNESATALSSVGLGLDWRFKSAHAELYYGYALDKPEEQQSKDLQDDGVHFQVRFDVF